MSSTRSASRWNLALAAGGVAAVLAGVAGMVLAAAGANRIGLGLRPSLIAAELALAAAALIAALALGLPLRSAPGTPVRHGRALLAGVALWVGSLGVVGLQQLVWAPPPGYLDAFMELHAALRPESLLDAALALTAIAFAPALCEELLFRGVALPALAPLLGPVGAALGSAALFGLIHVDAVGDEISLYRAPFAFAVGLGLAALRLVSGSLVPAILAHGVLNATTWALVAVLTERLDATAPTPGMSLVAAAQLAGGVGVLTLLLRGWPQPAALMDRNEPRTTAPPSGSD